jgi:hypothetical protein
MTPSGRCKLKECDPSTEVLDTRYNLCLKVVECDDPDTLNYCEADAEVTYKFGGRKHTLKSKTGCVEIPVNLLLEK